MQGISKPLKINGQVVLDDIEVCVPSRWKRIGDSNCIYNEHLTNEVDYNQQAIDIINYLRIWISRRIIINSVHTYVNTANATSVAYFALYDVDKKNRCSGRLLRDFGSVDCSTTGHKQLSTSPLILEPGEYFKAVVVTGAQAAISEPKSIQRYADLNSGVTSIQADAFRHNQLYSVVGGMPSVLVPLLSVGEQDPRANESISTYYFGF